MNQTANYSGYPDRVAMAVPVFCRYIRVHFGEFYWVTSEADCCTDVTVIRSLHKSLYRLFHYFYYSF